MKISKAAKTIEPSLSRMLFNMAKNYSDVIDLTLGDPDIFPSEYIRDAACKAVKSGKTRYSANAGLQNLRELIAKNVQKEYCLTVDPMTEIAVTVGGMEALFLSIACLVDNEDEVIIFAPYYVNYKQMVSMCGGTPVIVNTREEDCFSVVAEDLEKYVTSRTVAMIINTPCNPTGTVLDKNALRSIGEIAKKYNLTIISDEVYRTLIFDGVKHESVITLPGMRERTILVDSLSKRFAMTGYRLGYVVAPEDLICSVTKMQENVAACAPLPSQYAGIAAFEKCENDTFIRDEFQKRRDFIYKAINNIEGLSCLKPAATFYLFVNISKTGLKSLDFAYALLKKEHVAVVPGITYGDAYDHFVRIAFTQKQVDLERAVIRIERFMNDLRQMHKE